MDIVFKGRHTSLRERFRQQATMKLEKLGKLDHKVIRVDVEVATENNPRQNGRRERVELTIRSRGPAIRAEAASDDRYAALDLALAKLESRLRRASDRRKPRHGSHDTVRLPATANGQAADSNGAQDGQHAEAGAAEPAQANGATSAGDMVPIEMEGDGPLVVRQKVHAAAPMTIDQALFEMELVGHDFYLFIDKESGCSSVVYRRCGYRYGVIRLVEEHAPQQSEHLVAL